MRTFEQGDVVRARGRDWVVVCPPEGNVDLLVADPYLTDEECQRIQRVERVNETKNTAIPHNVYVQRSALDLEEIE